jgi:CheY-like chemotaxis protein
VGEQAARCGADLLKEARMSRTLLGIVKLGGTPEEPCVFKQACDKAGVSFRCESVSSAEDGISYLNGSGPYADRRRYPMASLIVLDWDLPDNGSLQALCWIRSRPTLRYLPVVVLSDSKNQASMKRAYDRGASSYLLKPQTFDGLVELIRMIDRYWLALNQTPGP